MTYAAHAQRVVSTSPQITELLYQLGLGDALVATVEGSEYPPAAKKLPSIGQLFFPSLEKTVAFRPDFVVLDTHNLQPTFAAALKGMGISTFSWNTQSVQSLLADANRFTEVLSKPRSELLARAETCLKALQRNASPSVPALTFVWTDPPIVAGSNAFLDSLVELLGFSNALPNRLALPYVTVSEEWLIANRPERVFFLDHSKDASEQTRRRIRQWWPSNPPETVALSAETFARASLTPLQHLESLAPRKPLPRECAAHAN